MDTRLTLDDTRYTTLDTLDTHSRTLDTHSRTLDDTIAQRYTMTGHLRGWTLRPLDTTTLRLDTTARHYSRPDAFGRWSLLSWESASTDFVWPSPYLIHHSKYAVGYVPTFPQQNFFRVCEA